MSNFAVLICGFDKYSDIWNPWNQLFEKYFDATLINVYFSTEEKPPINDKLIHIKCGKNKSWCERVIFALNQIIEEYVLILMDDFFLVDNCDVKYMIEIANFMKHNSIDCMRISPYPPAKRNNYTLNSIKYGKIEHNDSYSISLQAAIWNKRTFIEIVKDYSTPWEVEFLGSQNCKIEYNLYSLAQGDSKKIYSDISTEGAIQGGKWTRKAIKYMKKNKISFSTKNIKVESIFRWGYKKIKLTILKPIIILIKKTKFYNYYRKKRYDRVIKKVNR